MTLKRELIISEGKFHQIKRMFQAFNYKVIELKRIKFNNLKLPNSLKLGSYIVIKKKIWLIINNKSNSKYFKYSM
ncbi:hypothetical protein NWP96_06175 [Mycoplasmopsis cynos]|nr:hypothetical protein [Mycoplasmopsis cynos]